MKVKSPAPFFIQNERRESDMSGRYGFEIPISNNGIPVRTSMGQTEPVAHPKNCRTECPYGFDRAFCFPCMAKIMGQFYEDKKRRRPDEGLAGVTVSV